jgi:hypothetical protein
MFQPQMYKVRKIQFPDVSLLKKSYSKYFNFLLLQLITDLFFLYEHNLGQVAEHVSRTAVMVIIVKGLSLLKFVGDILFVLVQDETLSLASCLVRLSVLF